MAKSKLSYRSRARHNKDKILIYGGAAGLIAVAGYGIARAFGSGGASMQPSKTIDGNTPDVTYTLTANGFTPHENVTYTHRFGTIEISSTMAALSDGSITISAVAVVWALDFAAISNAVNGQMDILFDGETSRKHAQITLTFVNWGTNQTINPPKINSFSLSQNTNNAIAADFHANVTNVSTSESTYRIGIVPVKGGDMLAYMDETLQPGESIDVTVTQAVPWHSGDSYYLAASFPNDAGSPIYDTTNVNYSTAPFVIP